VNALTTDLDQKELVKALRRRDPELVKGWAQITTAHTHELIQVAITFIASHARIDWARDLKHR
jgi:hypothetical protein